MEKVSREKLNALQKILQSDYGVSLSTNDLDALADKLLRLALLAKKHAADRMLRPP